MCDCKNVTIGGYENQVELTRPEHMGLATRTICIDRCLVPEIQDLWAKGIWTTGCCCGHNIPGQKPFIGVKFEHIPQMKKMGYVVQFNPVEPQREDSFWPKTTLCLLLKFQIGLFRQIYSNR